jgi:hypothetical protein
MKKRKHICWYCKDNIKGTTHEATIRYKEHTRVRRLCLGCLMYLEELGIKMKIIWK